jgi:hypothetical protein
MNVGPEEDSGNDRYDRSVNVLHRWPKYDEMRWYDQQHSLYVDHIFNAKADLDPSHKSQICLVSQAPGWRRIHTRLVRRRWHI